MRYWLFSILFLCLTVKLLAQDTLIDTRGEVTPVFVVEKDDDDVVYTTENKPNAYRYRVNKIYIDRVNFESGNVWNMRRERDSIAALYSFRHRVSWMYSDLILTSFMAGYEYFNKSGTLGLRVVGSYGRDRATAEFNINLYPTSARGRVKYLAGPFFKGALLGFSESDLFSELQYIGCGVGNGISINITPRLNTTFYTGFGVQVNSYEYTLFDQMGNIVGKQRETALGALGTATFSFGYNFGKQ